MRDENCEVTGNAIYVAKTFFLLGLCLKEEAVLQTAFGVQVTSEGELYVIELSE